MCLSCLSLPVQADQATADAIDNMNTGMWARELIGNGEGFTGFCDLSKSVAKKVFGKKQPKKPKIEEVSNGNIKVNGQEYTPVENANIKPVTYKAPTGYTPVGDYLLSNSSVKPANSPSSSPNH